MSQPTDRATDSIPSFRSRSDKLYSNVGNPAVLGLIGEAHGKRILDLGCGAAGNGSILSASGAQVYGITLSSSEAAAAGAVLKGCTVADLAVGIPLTSGSHFDIVLLSHVLEHVADPVQLLIEARRVLDSHGWAVIAVPSVTHYAVRLNLLKGNWTYQETGVLDSTHLRFFSLKGIHATLSAARLEVIETAHQAVFPFWFLRSLLPRRVVRAANCLASRVWPELFAVQFVFKVRSF